MDILFVNQHLCACVVERKYNERINDVVDTFIDKQESTVRPLQLFSRGSALFTTHASRPTHAVLRVNKYLQLVAACQSVVKRRTKERKFATRHSERQSWIKCSKWSSHAVNS